MSPPPDTTIVIADPDDPAALAERVVQAANGATLPRLVLVKAAGDLSTDGARADVLLAPPKLAATLVPHLPGLRWVQCTWAGVGPLLAPVASHRNPSLQLTAAKGLFGPRMAEYIFGWLLTLERRVLDYAAQQRAHQWQPLPWGDLQGSTMLLLGTGSIGAHVAGIARAFGMRTLGVSRRGEPVDGIDEVLPVSRLHTALGTAHYVIASLPDTPDTRGLLDAQAFAAMRDDAVLINVGRGTLVQEQALVDALANGRLRAAVLDVFAEEPLSPEHPFWDTPGLFLTPHVAAVTPEDGITSLFLANLRRYRMGERLEGLVDTRRGY